jgi:hypothetical protein
MICKLINVEDVRALKNMSILKNKSPGLCEQGSFVKCFYIDYYRHQKIHANPNCVAPNSHNKIK